jgi:hypothetical protein
VPGPWDAIRRRLSRAAEVGRAVRAARAREFVGLSVNVPVSYQPQVLVVGAGVSGIAAAVAAGRSGADTLLIERQGSVGGLVTSGLVTPFSMQLVSPDGELIVRGIVRDLFERLAAADGVTSQWWDWKIPKLPIDPEVFKLVVIQMLEEAGVRVLLNTAFVHADSADRRVQHIHLFNKSGFSAVRPGFVVDCSGEADVARSLSVPTTLNADVDPSALKVVSEALRNRGWVRRTEKTSSLQFSIVNVDLQKAHDFIVANPETYATAQRGDLVEDVDLFSYLWRERGVFYLPHQTSFKELIQAAVEQNEFRPEIGKYHLIDDSGIGLDGMRGYDSVIVNANRVMLNPFVEEEISDALMRGQEVCFEIWRFLRDHVMGFEGSRVGAVAPFMGVRRGAQIIGDHVYTAEERESFLQYDDVIGTACRKTAQAYEVPYSAMLPQGIDNLLVASGKTVSTDDFLPYRVKPVCMILGQAAGTAAAMCVTRSRGETPRSLSIRDLQRQLLEDGAYLGGDARLAALGLPAEVVSGAESPVP